MSFLMFHDIQKPFDQSYVSTSEVTIHMIHFKHLFRPCFNVWYPLLHIFLSAKGVASGIP